MALNGKVALVTGAAQGLGRAYSEILLQNGAKVAVLDVNEAEGKSLQKAFSEEYGPERTIFITCDVQSEKQFKAAFQKTIETFGRIDIVCNNAGISNEKDWETTISINLNGVVRGTYLALEHMNKLTGGHGGSIINIASMAGLLPFLSVPIYTATKFGVVGFSRAMASASAVSGYGVQINMICPSFVQTDILRSFSSEEKAGQFAHLREKTQQLKDKTGVLEAFDVAKVFLQLVTDETRNGEAVAVRCSGSDYVTFPKYELPSSPGS